MLLDVCVAFSSKEFGQWFEISSSRVVLLFEQRTILTPRTGKTLRSWLGPKLMVLKSTEKQLVVNVLSMFTGVKWGLPCPLQL